jgi:hypothetical protein
VSIKDANKKKKLETFGSKVMLSVIGTFIYRDGGVDKWPMT